MFGPNPNAVHPNERIPRVCFIKNTITRPNIIVGDYTYYDDPVDAEHFERHVTHHYDFIGDKLIIGKFCAIGQGVEFVMNGANHAMRGISTYPFHIMGGGWESAVPALDELPRKGDTVVGNDVWLGQNVTVLPGVHIGSGAIIGANAVVSGDIPAYAVAVGNPCRVVRMRFDADRIESLLQLQWWDWPPEIIFANLDALTGGDWSRIRAARA